MSFSLLSGIFLIGFILVYYIAYRYTSTCMYTDLATVVFLYWGHCECLASLVGPVRVLSAVMFL